MATTIKLSKAAQTALVRVNMTDKKLIEFMNTESDSQSCVPTRNKIRWMCAQILGNFEYKFEVTK